MQVYSKGRGRMKRAVVAALVLASFATGLSAQREQERAGLAGSGAASQKHYFLPRGAESKAIPKRVSNLNYHSGGQVIPQARVVFIFWGPTFANASHPDNVYATTLQLFRNQFGTNSEFNTITQYYQIIGGVKTFIGLTNLAAGTPDWFDTSNPPTAVTDSIVQQEVSRYTASNGVDDSTIYEVVIPSTSYSDDGTGATSCGGPNLAYCAYHSFFNSGSHAVKYSIEPWPGCGGCQVAGWTNVQNQEHFVCHETREAVTDQQLNAWFDRVGNEADDKCAWSPPPFLVNGYGYQYEWSNASSACVKTR
jgi:hypothetical protein